jgi:LacI family transcriptional regulator
MKRPTMTDVARHAGVSKSTVSHVINETRFVEEETRQRVLSAVEALGYRPSAVARSLTTNRTQTVGVIVSDSSNYFFGELLQGVEDVLRTQGYALLVCNTAEILEREAHYLDTLLRQRVDGIIAAATSQRWDILTEFEAEHMPVVFVDREFDGLRGPFVGADNRGGARAGTAHMVEQGHQRIGMLAGFQRLSSLRQRAEGFREELLARGIPLREEWVVTSLLSIEGGREAMHRLLGRNERPTAVLMGNNLLSLGALMAISELGIRCPDELALVGFDDHPWATVSSPPLTVVRQPAERIGRTAAEMLLDLIAGQTPDEDRIVFDCDLIVRASC